MDELDYLKPGDEVVVWYRQGFTSGLCRIQKVERVTKTRIITDEQVAYNKRSGYRVGDTGFHPQRIELVTDKNLKQVEETRQSTMMNVLRRKISDALPELSLETLKEIYVVIKKEAGNV